MKSLRSDMIYLFRKPYMDHSAFRISLNYFLGRHDLSLVGTFTELWLMRNKFK